MNLAVVEYAKAVITDGSMQIWTGKLVESYEICPILATFFIAILIAGNSRHFHPYSNQAITAKFAHMPHMQASTTVWAQEKKTPSRIFHRT